MCAASSSSPQGEENAFLFSLPSSYLDKKPNTTITLPLPHLSSCCSTRPLSPPCRAAITAAVQSAITTAFQRPNTTAERPFFHSWVPTHPIMMLHAFIWVTSNGSTLSGAALCLPWLHRDGGTCACCPHHPRPCACVIRSLSL